MFQDVHFEQTTTKEAPIREMRKPMASANTELCAMSDDDSISIESNPFERPVLTEERLAYYRKIHEENPHPAYRGPPLESPSPEPGPKPSPEKPKSKRTTRMLAGLEPPQFGYGLSRSPYGRVRSWRLQAKTQQHDAMRPVLRPPPSERAQPQRPTKSASKTAVIQKRTTPRRRRTRLVK